MVKEKKFSRNFQIKSLYSFRDCFMAATDTDYAEEQ